MDLMYIISALLLFHGVSGMASEPDCMYPPDILMEKPVVVSGPGMLGSGIKEDHPVMLPMNAYQLPNETMTKSTRSMPQMPGPAMNRARFEKLMLMQNSNIENPKTFVHHSTNLVHNSINNSMMRSFLNQHINEMVNDPILLNSFKQTGVPTNLTPATLKRMILEQMTTLPLSSTGHPVKGRPTSYGEMPIMPISPIPIRKPLMGSYSPPLRSPFYPAALPNTPPFYPTSRLPFMTKPPLYPPSRRTPFYPSGQRRSLYPPGQRTRFYPPGRRTPYPPRPFMRSHRYFKRSRIRHMFRRLYKRRHAKYEAIRSHRYWSRWSETTMHHYIQAYHQWHRTQKARHTLRTKAKAIKKAIKERKHEVKRAMWYLKWINQNHYFTRKLQRAKRKRILKMQKRWISGIGRWWRHPHRRFYGYRRYTPYVYHQARNPYVYYPYLSYYSSTHYPLHHYYTPLKAPTNPYYKHHHHRKIRYVRYRLVQQ